MRPRVIVPLLSIFPALTMSSLSPSSSSRRKPHRWALVLLAAALAVPAQRTWAQQPPETLPFFWQDQAFDNHGVDNVNLYNGDDGIAVPLGPAYTLGPTGYQYQLTAFHTAKFWHFSTATCTTNAQFAWIAGDPTLGVGWSLLPGYVVKRASGVTEYYSPNGGVSQFTIPGASPYSAVTTDGSHLRITAIPTATNPTSYTVEFPDGSIQTFDHSYAPPVASPPSVDFSNLDYLEAGLNRLGLGNIKDRFGNTLVSVTWGAGSTASEVSTIVLSPFGSSIAFTWANYLGSTGITRRVIDHVRLPAPGGKQLNVQFSYQDGFLNRNSFDTSNGSGCTVSPTQAKVPELTLIAFSDPGSPASIKPFSYALSYRATAGLTVQKQGTINVMTLPNGGTVSYDYCVTAGHACNQGAVGCDPFGARTPSHCDPAMIAEPPDTPDVTDNFHPPGQTFFDNSPAVAVRTEFDPYGNRTATVNYDRDQFKGLLDGVPDDFLVVRRASVTYMGNDDAGPAAYVRRHYFKVDSADPFNPRGAAGIELDRRYYSGTDVTQPPIRVMITCYAVGGCGFEDGTGGYIDYDFTPTGRTPPTRVVTWYGPLPAGNGGGTCSSATTKCSSVAYSNYNSIAGRYNTTVSSTTLPSGVTRTLDVDWTPSTATNHWILDLFDHRWTWDGGGSVPAGSNGDTVVREDFEFDTEGFLKEIDTWDSTTNKAIGQCFYSPSGDGTVVDQYSATFPSSIEPGGALCPGSIPSTGLDGDAFGQHQTFANLLPTQTYWRKGSGSIGWNAFDVVRDSGTGFISESHDPNYSSNSALKTTYTYDALGRVVQIQPPGGSAVEWPTTFCYIPKVSGSTGLVIVKKIKAATNLDPNSASGICQLDDGAPVAGSGPILGQQLDGFGRVVRELRRNNRTLSTGSYFETKDTWYDKGGHVRFAADWKPCAGATSIASCAVNQQATSGPGTVYGNFDAFGRTTNFAAVDEITTLANWASDVFVDRTDTRVAPQIAFSDSYEKVSALCVNGTWAGGTCTGGIGGSPGGVQSATEFDNLGRITKVTEPNPTSGVLSSDLTTYGYNVLDKVDQVSQGLQTRNFSYSAFGFLKTEQTPENGCGPTGGACTSAGNATTNYTLYGSVGNLLKKTDGKPTLTTYNYSYDAAGRLTLVTTGASSPFTEFVVNCYDGTGACGDANFSNFAGGRFPKGQLTRRIGINEIPFPAAPVFDDFTYGDVSGALCPASDLSGRLCAQATSVGARGVYPLPPTDVTRNGFGRPVVQNWTYNSLGAIATHTHPRPTGSATTLTVNDSTYTSGLLTNITANTGTIQQIVAANYHESGRLADYTTGSSTTVKTTIAADPVVPSRALSFKSVKSPGNTTLWSSGNYVYDGTSSVKSIGSGSPADTFAYDGRSRITAATYNGVGPQGFTFDRYGNLTSKTGINPVTLTSDATTNHLTSGIGTYDDRGNLLTFTGAAGTQTLFHDLLNRMYRTVDPSGTDFTYLYDAGGERIAKFPTDLGATRREFARLIMEARGDALSSCSAYFADVVCSSNTNDGPYISTMKEIGITTGCGGGNFCPDAQTQRDQSSVFFLKGRWCTVDVDNCTWTPPACTPPPNQRFADVPCPSQFADWIEELADEGITSGCGSGNFCPTDKLGSWQMLAWAQKIWPSYNPLPRASVVTYRDEESRVITEGLQSGGADASAIEAYQRDNVFLGSQLVSSAVWSGVNWATVNYQFYAVDHLGSTRLATDTSGTVLGTYKYWPYGDDGPGSSTAAQRLLFDGMERDTENKHYYDHARTQDFNIGRFLSADRLFGLQANPQSWNRYAYVINEPTKLTDPWGLAFYVCSMDEHEVKHCTFIPGYQAPPSNNGSDGEGGGNGSKPCGTTGFGGGIGVSGGVTGDAGLGVAGVSANGSVGAGAFFDSKTGLSAGVFAAGAAVAYLFRQVIGAPSQASQPVVLGEYAGAGASVFFTNARSVQQLGGPFQTYSLNVGAGPAKFSAQYAYSGSTWMVSIGPPAAGVSAPGASLTKMTTTTVTTRTGCH